MPASFSEFTTLTLQELADQLHTNLETGLITNQLQELQTKYGPNQLPHQHATWQQILFRQFKSSFIYLLLGAIVLAALLGEYTDAGMILLFVAINTALGFYQEYKSEQTAKFLTKYIDVTAKVIRNHQEHIIPSHELVPGDLIVLNAGDIIPADLRFIHTHNLTIDESILTGESVAINKVSTSLKSPTSELFQATNIGFSGTTVTAGEGKGIIIATGTQTVMGQTAKLATDTTRVSAFETSLNRFSRFILQMIVITLILIIPLHVAIKGTSALNFAELSLFVIALAVSVIPEALSVVTTFSLSRGAIKLAKDHVVVKRLSAIEDLGSIEILCTDKTGTVTENKLSIAEVNSSNSDHTLLYAALAGLLTTGNTHQPNNAFDLAIWNRLTENLKLKTDNYHQLGELPFDPERKRNSVLVKNKDKNVLIVRGAPEVILPACLPSSRRPPATLGVAFRAGTPGSIVGKTFKVSNLTSYSTKIPTIDPDFHRDDGIHRSDNHSPSLKEIQNWISNQGRLGRRVIAIATKTNLNKSNYTADQELKHLTLQGLISFVDPIKPSSKNAISQAHKLSVQVKMITGDSPEVAGAVALEIGLINHPEHVITGAELSALPIHDQDEAVENHHVFARISPEQKYSIIKLLQHHHEVGFLGEGINDAPALKIAQVGLVVNGASDIARESADIILLENSLSTIIDGIKQGREVFTNTIKYIKATLASNFGNFYAVVVASLLIDYLPMLPLQLLLLNLLSDFPMIAIATDTTDPGELKRPKNYDIKEIALIATVLGLVSTTFDFLFFAIFKSSMPAVLQTAWFTGSVLTELVFLYSVRTRLPFFKASKPSAILVILTILAAAATLILPFTSWGQSTFHFIILNHIQYGIIFSLVTLYFLTTETIKWLYYHHQKHSLSSLS